MVRLGCREERLALGYLVCWIPPTFVETVQDGIDVNPVDCIGWLPELEQALGLGPSPSV
jgi:hypothetical protein